MKMIRIILSVVVIALVMNLQSGCQKSQTKNHGTDRIETTPQATKLTELNFDKPVLDVKNPVFEMGKIAPGRKIKCEFAFSNSGTEMLHINKVLSTCQCTVAQLTKKDYAPGDSGTITIYYHSPSHESRVQKYLHILSNDLKEPKYELTLKGKVEYMVQVQPGKADLFLNQDNGGIKPIVLKSKDGKKFAVKHFTSTGEVIKIDFDPNEEKTQFILKPIVDVTKLKNNLTGKISISLTHPETKMVNISYGALPLYTISPGRLIVNDKKHSKTVKREVWLKSNYFEKVDIKSITSAKGYMEVARQEHQKNSVKLFINVTPPAQKINTRKILLDRLNIEMADGEKITLPMSWLYLI